MRLLALALICPCLATAADFADPDLTSKYEKVLSIYPASKPQIQNAHTAWLSFAKADCDLKASIKGNNLSSTHKADCMAEASSNRANFYNQIIINKN